MAIHQIIKDTIWDYQKKHIDFLYSKRKNHKNLSDRIGINISIIINSACYIEGALEYYSKKILNSRMTILRKQNFDEFPLRRTYNTFIKSVAEEFENRISRTTGLEQFNSLLELLSHRHEKSTLRQYKNWEVITVLFQFRNVLAHGREVSAKRVSSYLTDGLWVDQFGGGYRKAEEYLLKKKLISKRFTENGKINHLFTNKVTDHFSKNAKQFLKYAKKIIDSELAVPDDIFKNIDIKKIKTSQYGNNRIIV